MHWPKEKGQTDNYLQKPIQKYETLLKTGGELRYSGMISNSCSTSGTYRVSVSQCIYCPSSTSSSSSSSSVYRVYSSLSVILQRDSQDKSPAGQYLQLKIGGNLIYTTKNYTDRQPGSATQVVSQHGWEPLQVRRVKIRLFLLFKIQHNLVAILAEDLPGVIWVPYRCGIFQGWGDYSFIGFGS
jgi:hypothetical protein